MNPDPPVDILVCGAGAAGLALGIELARRGVRFRLVEKASQPFQGSRGKGLQPRSQEIFEDMGVLDRLFATGGVYPPVRTYQADGTWTDEPIGGQPPTPAEPYQHAMLVPQFLTERVLRDRLAELGHAVHFGSALRRFEQDDDGVTAHLDTPDGPQTIRCRWLVGADGGRSTVRQALGIGFPGKTLGVRAVVADVSLRGLPRDAWHRFNDKDMAAQVALCPLPGTALFQLQAPVPAEGDVDLSTAGLDQLVRTRTRRDGVRVEAVAWASAYTMNARLADRYRAGNVFIVGDAAHVHAPTGGQGLNTSVQDAYNLGWKLAAVLAGAPASLLDTYEEERRPIAADMLGLSARMLEATKRGDMKRGRETHQLDLGYPESSLAFPGSCQTAGGLRAGQRAPDAPVVGAAGQPTRLFDLFKGTHWTLLVHDVPPEALAARPGLHIHVVGPNGDLHDDAGHFARAYGSTPGECVLVRPDGYIGGIVAGRDMTELERYLRGVQPVRTLEP